MKEYRIRKKAIQELESAGYVCWYPPKTRWGKKKDIFGVFDMIALKNDVVRFIQLTTASNMAAREKKVIKFLEENRLGILTEIWGWDKKTKRFRIVFLKKKYGNS